MSFRRTLTILLAGALTLGANPPPPKTTPGWEPVDKDERGLWMQVQEYERELPYSQFVMKDPALNDYVRKVFCGMVGEAECKDVRIYLMRTPYFNASMAPNGMMQVWSGLFLRARNEAQFAAIIGHEFTHYKNRHSLQGFREAKKQMTAAAWMGIFIGNLAYIGALGSYFSFSREMESEADAGGIPLMVKAGYDPMAASAVWEQLRAEMDATAAERKRKSRKDKDRGMFQSHPPTAERMATLKALAAKVELTGPVSLRRTEYVKALAPFWADFVDDQIKLNDFGATEFLLNSLASEGWTPELSYARGELYRYRGQPADLTKAVDFYRAAVAGGPVEAHRGLGLSLLRSGQADEGKASLKTYLKLRPNAADKSMIAMLAGG